MSNVRLTPMLHRIVKNAPSGFPPKAIAAAVNKNYCVLMNELTKKESHKLGVELLIPLMQVTGSVEPLHRIADCMGGVFVQIPSHIQHSEHPVHKQCLLTVKEFGDLMLQTANALDDGTITLDEKSLIAWEGYETIASITALLQVIERNVDALENSSNKNKKDPNLFVPSSSQKL